MIVKSIVIMAGGMADEPGLLPTPLMSASAPSMRLLAGEGKYGLAVPVEPGFQVDDINAILSFLGYDLRKGIPTRRQLAEIAGGLWPIGEDMDFSFLTVPVFSGHGSMVSPVAVAQGIGRLAQLEVPHIPVDGLDWPELATRLAQETIARSRRQDMVFLYVDWPAQASFGNDPEAKKEIIEIIDQNIISPIADYVWHSDEYIELCVTSGYGVSSLPPSGIEGVDYPESHRNMGESDKSGEPGRLNYGKYLDDKVPIILYFNDAAPQANLPVLFNEIDARLGSLDFSNPCQVVSRWIEAATITPPNNP